MYLPGPLPDAVQRRIVRRVARLCHRTWRDAKNRAKDGEITSMNAQDKRQDAMQCTDGCTCVLCIPPSRALTAEPLPGMQALALKFLPRLLPAIANELKVRYVAPLQVSNEAKLCCLPYSSLYEDMIIVISVYSALTRS